MADDKVSKIVIKVHPGSSYPTSVSGPDWAVSLLGMSLSSTLAVAKSLGYLQAADVEKETVGDKECDVYTLVKNI
jgi:hypothetical protein